MAALEARIVPTGSVRAALAAVESGAADAAIVYRTDIRVSLEGDRRVDGARGRRSSHLYPGAIIRTTASADEAQRFLDFLRTDTAVRIFERFGFTPYQ